jgi:hypothetical protein
MMGSFDGGVDGERISRLEEWTASKKKWSDCQLPVNDVGVIDERQRGEASVELRQKARVGGGISAGGFGRLTGWSSHMLKESKNVDG